MKTFSFFRYILLMCLGLILVSCEDSLPDYYTEKEFELQNFNRIELGDAFQIEIMKADEFMVIAKGEDSDLNDLILRVEDHSLTGQYREGSRSHKRTLIQVYLPELTEVEVHAASTTKISGFDSEEDLSLKISGASETYFTGSVKNLEVTLDGASLLSLNGESEDFSADVFGASEMNARSFIANTAQVKVHSHSHANLSVLSSLSGELHSGSSLIYYGSPAQVEVNVETGSSLQHGN